MSLAFATLLSILIGEKINRKAGKYLLLPFVMIGVASVVYWIYTEVVRYHGDLRLYGVVQFGAIITAPFILFLFPSRYTHSEYYVACLFLYVFAKFAELLDRQIYAATGYLISGHSIKHLLSAAGIEIVCVMIEQRICFQDKKLSI